MTRKMSFLGVNNCSILLNEIAFLKNMKKRSLRCFKTNLLNH